MALNHFDSSIIAFFNAFSQKSWYVDHLMVFISQTRLVKGGLLILAIWWLWFRNTDERKAQTTREHIVATIVSCFAALFVARALAFALPFRGRPFNDPHLHFRLPYGAELDELLSWSSFPSDHAAMALALAVGLWFVSRRIGVAAIIYAFVIICLPRVYLGIHYPTDIIAGALIGSGIAWLGNTDKVRSYIAGRTMPWLSAAPGAFYTGFLLVTYQMADMFDEVRNVGSAVLHLARHLLS
jgi:undecaprenyl-diphosphatase